MPSSGLELAVSGVPNSVFNESTTQTPDKLKGYLFADHGVRSYRREGNNTVIVTRTDGKRIALGGAPKNANAAEQYVRGFLGNRGIKIDNKTAEKIAKMLREKG